MNIINLLPSPFGLSRVRTSEVQISEDPLYSRILDSVLDDKTVFGVNFSQNSFFKPLWHGHPDMHWMHRLVYSHKGDDYPSDWLIIHEQAQQEKCAVNSCKVLRETLKFQKGLNWAQIHLLIVMVKCCHAWNYTAVAVSRQAVFGVLFLRQVLLVVRSFWPYIQRNRTVWTHVQGQSVKSSPEKLLSESKRVCGWEVAEKNISVLKLISL